MFMCKVLMQTVQSCHSMLDIPELDTQGRSQSEVQGRRRA
jgi:hypothetical protein